MAVKITGELLTPYNYNAGTTDRIKYIVIHYVGALGGAEANCIYYYNAYRGASAHYFVGFDGEIWRSVRDKDIAWSVGAKTYYHTECRNSNSISIEMCVRKKTKPLSSTDKDWYFEDATVKSTIELTKYLMEKYNIDANHVIRHYDVTHKICPNPYVYNTTDHTWNDFKKALTSKTSASVEEVPKEEWKKTGTAKVTGNGVRLRETPNGPIKGSLDKNATLEVDGKTSGSWVHVKSNKYGIGWMSSTYVSIDKPVTTTNSNTTTTSTKDLIKQGQTKLNSYCNAGLAVDGIVGIKSKKAIIKALQVSLNKAYGLGLATDGINGKKTNAGYSSIKLYRGAKSYVVTFVEIALLMKGINPKGVEMPGQYGAGLETAIKTFKKSRNISVNGTINSTLIDALIK